MKSRRITPKPGQESVWDYPRPPRLESTDKHIQVVYNGVMIADTFLSLRVLETSHPPVYYIPPQNILLQRLFPTNHQTTCEWKGIAQYYSVEVNGKKAENAAWYYPTPKHPYEGLKNYVAFYVSKMDLCLVDGEEVIAQPGDFYGGWITKDIVGPFKGETGSWNW
jgi:uncharacterized protein (DUF427 family)